MKPNKPGQVARFHTPLPDENPNQLFVVLEIKADDERSLVDIKALNTGLSFPPINTVKLDDLEVVKVDTADLFGHQVNINKSDNSLAKGKIVKLSEQKIMLELTKGVKGIETNFWLTIEDEKGIEHTGNLFVN